jgi:hypothetical protein
VLWTILRFSASFVSSPSLQTPQLHTRPAQTAQSKVAGNVCAELRHTATPAQTTAANSLDCARVILSVLIHLNRNGGGRNGSRHTLGNTRRGPVFSWQSLPAPGPGKAGNHLAKKAGCAQCQPRQHRRVPAPNRIVTSSYRRCPRTPRTLRLPNTDFQAQRPGSGSIDHKNNTQENNTQVLCRLQAKKMACVKPR